MTNNEKAAIIGYWRNGASFMEIGYVMGIPDSYAEMIVSEYLGKKKASH